jgi:sugar-specific transcriptional regulator TrmB
LPELAQIYNTIQELGFTSYEAKAYVSLLQHHPVTRYELSKNSGVPRSAIYGVIKKLEKIGAVNALYSEPELYVPLQPEQFLYMLHERYKQKVGNARESLTGIESNLEADHLWNIVGYQNMLHKATEIIKKAQKEIYLSIWQRELKMLKKDLMKAAECGVKIIIFSFTEIDFSEGNVFTYSLDEYSIEKFWAHKIILVTDSNELLMGEANDKTPKKTAWTQNRAIVDIATNHIILDITLFGIRFNLDVSKIVSQMQKGEITLLGKLLSDKYPDNPLLHLDKLVNL